MYLFLFYLVVHFVNEVDLWDPADYKVHDRAAETAKLINIVQKADQFEVKFPLKDDRGVDKGKDDVDIFETMKLIQKNYDVNRKFNIIPKKERLQHISNPQVLETYKNLGDSDRQQTEAYDDLDIQGSTLRSYYDELINSRYFRTNDKKRTERGSANNDDNDETAAKEVKKRRHIGGEKESKEKDTASDSSHSPENSEEVKKYNEAFNLVKPIVAEMLSKYVVRDSKEIHTDSDRNKVSNNPMKRILIKEKYVNTEPESNDEDTQTKASDINTNVKRFKKLEQAPIEIKVTKSLSSGEQEKNIKLIKNNENINDPQDDRNLKKKFQNKISTETFAINPTLTIEHNTSEEMNKYEVDQNRNSIVKRKPDFDMEKHQNVNVKLKNKKTNTREEKETSKGSGGVSMEEHIIDWSDYDENKNTNKQDSKLNDENTIKTNKYINKKNIREKFINKVKENNGSNKRLISIENKKKDDEHNEYDRYKSKVSTKRKGDWNEKDDNWDQNNDDRKDDKTLKKKYIDWDNKDESQKSKNWKLNNKKIEKDDYDLNKKKGKWNKKGIDWNKKDDDWNKSDDKYDKKDDDWNKKGNKLNKKGDNWNKNDNKWNKKDDDWNKNDNKWNIKHDDWNEKDKKLNIKDDEYYAKEDKKKFKKNNWKNSYDDGNLKRDSAWDGVGTNKKQNSGWGSYDSFKNILEEKNNNAKNFARPLDIQIPKIDYKMPKPVSWDSYDRESHYNKPKKQGRMGIHRTPIPIVGKRPLYAD